MNGHVDSSRALRVCVCTSYSAGAEPRAPRHALAIAAIDPKIQVTFVECVPRSAAAEVYNPFAGAGNIRRLTYRYAHRGAGRLQLAAEKLARFMYRSLFRLFGRLHPGALSTRFVRFRRFLDRLDADVYFAHNLETLLPVCEVAQRCGSLAMFDSMEFHSDMGDSQNELDRRIIAQIEQRCLPRCVLVLASSEEMAVALAATYGIPKPLTLYNVPPVDPNYHVCDHQGLSLYWRNAVLGFGQRGLQDVLNAIQELPEDIVLHLQGRLPTDDGAELRVKIKSLGLDRRVFIHGPYSPPEAVRVASQYCVGLCLEHGGIRNHELTVSNKIFDYLMAGLVVVASDLPSLRGVIERSGGGVCFEPGNPADLAAKIMELRNNRPGRLRLAANARAYAIETANREIEMARFQEAFRQALGLQMQSANSAASA